MVVIFVVDVVVVFGKRDNKVSPFFSLSILQMGENFAPKKKVLVATHCQEIECFMPRQVGKGFFFT